MVSTTRGGFASIDPADLRGRFRFHKLSAGTYTLAVFEPERGEARQTIEVGPGTANSKGRVAVTLRMESAKFESNDATKRRSIVSARELSIPVRARQEYGEAQKRLSRRDVDVAVAHLQRAVEIAPQFSAAWNQLGTIAYQTRKYPAAEKYFCCFQARDLVGWRRVIQRQILRNT